jgi:hypothetical protein
MSQKISFKNLVSLVDPFKDLFEFQKPISKDNINKIISDLDFEIKKTDNEYTQVIKKIAFLVKNYDYPKIVIKKVG